MNFAQFLSNLTTGEGLALIGAALVAAIVYMIKKKKKGGCSTGCGGCPYSSSCQGGKSKKR